MVCRGGAQGVVRKGRTQKGHAKGSWGKGTVPKKQCQGGGAQGLGQRGRATEMCREEHITLATHNVGGKDITTHRSKPPHLVSATNWELEDGKLGVGRWDARGAN